MPALVIVLLVLLLSGCGDRAAGPVGVLPTVAVRVDSSSVAGMAVNVLSALVEARVRAADSVAVRYRILGDGTVMQTPAVAPIYGTARIPVLGLHAATAYTLQAVAFGPQGMATGADVYFVTDPLPPDLPAFTAGGTDPSPGFVVLAAGRYGLVIDNTGRIVWYYRFASDPGINFQAQPSGRYLARPSAEFDLFPYAWMEIDPLGKVARFILCRSPRTARFHDINVLADGSYWVMCDETRTMDLSAYGGSAAAQVTGTAVEHVGPDGQLLFTWSPFDELDITDLPAADRSGPQVNWTHGNAIDVDAAGNVYLSFRSLSEIVKIDRATGRIAWRMGGPRNGFTFVGDPAPPFARQHGLRLAGGGTFLLLDNLGDAAGSNVRRYELDEAARTVRLVATYRAEPAVVAALGGTTQPLPGGRVLVSYGSGARVEEYDADGNVVWQIEGDAGYRFRAQRILSLYEPGVGLPR
jgi:hypothetical protein